MPLEPSITATRTRAWPLLLKRAALRTATVLVPLLVLLLVVRRLQDRLEPLPGVALVMIALAAAVAASAWRRAWRRLEGTSAGPRWLQRYLPLATLALLGVALSIGGTHPLALMLFWALVAGEEILTGLGRERRTQPGAQRQPSVQPEELAVPHPGPLPEGEGEEEEELLPPGVSQQMTRSVEAGVETLECLLRVSFLPGQQNETVHVAFCPPLLNEPTGTCEPLAGPPCEVKLAALETYGARIEVKRSGPTSLLDEAIVALHAVSHSHEVQSPKY